MHARPDGESPQPSGAQIERLLSGSRSTVRGRKPHIHAPDRWAAPVPERHLITGIRADRS